MNWHDFQVTPEPPLQWISLTMPSPFPTTQATSPAANWTTPLKRQPVGRGSAAQDSAQHLEPLSVPLGTVLTSLDRATSTLKVARIKELEGTQALILAATWTGAPMPSISAE